MGVGRIGRGEQVGAVKVSGFLEALQALLKLAGFETGPDLAQNTGAAAGVLPAQLFVVRHRVQAPQLSDDVADFL
jgi:hypothetical protein